MTYTQKKAIRFLDYLDYTSEYHFDIVTPDGFFQLPYVHRWTKTYKSRVLAKMYKFQDWYLQNPTPVTMLTLTTRQRGLAHEEQLELLRYSYTNVMYAVRRIHKANNSVMVKTFDTPTGRLSTRREMPEDAKLNYIRILEPHKSGYAHLHILFLADFTEKNINHIKDLWQNKYGAGNDYGVDFSTSQQQNIKYPVAYLLKYLTKTLNKNKFTPGELIHHSTVYKMEHDPDYNGVRLFSVSRGLSKIMKLEEEEEDEENEKWQSGYIVFATDPNGDTFQKCEYGDFEEVLEWKLKFLRNLSFD